MTPLARVAVALVLLTGCGGEPRRETRRIDGAATHILSIEHRDEMGETYQLVWLRLTLDGQQIHLEGSREGEQALPEHRCVFRNSVGPGEHELGVEILYRGQGHGVFSYLSEYRFSVDHGTEVEVPWGAAVVHAVVVGYERGGATTPLEERPQVRVDRTVEPHDTGAGCYQ